MKRIYVETTVISYAVARPSRDTVIAGKQEITRRWLPGAMGVNRLFVAPAVLREIASGDPQAAALRRALVRGWEMFEPDKRFDDIAVELVRALQLPEKAVADAAHIAAAAAGGADFLVTWNCRHIANPDNRKKIHAILEREGVAMPEMCTPYDLLAPRTRS